MGKVKDWNGLINKAVAQEAFEAVLTLLPYEKTLDVLYESSAEAKSEVSFADKYIKAEREINAFMAREEEFFEAGRRMTALVKKSEERESAERRFSEKLLSVPEEESFGEAFTTFEGEKRRYAFETEEKRNEDEAFSAEELFNTISAEQEYFYVEHKDAEEMKLWEKSGMKLSKERVGRILDGAVKSDEGTRKHEIKVEMLKREAEGDRDDMDEILEEMTARLCAMMSRGADGIYM